MSQIEAVRRSRRADGGGQRRGARRAGRRGRDRSTSSTCRTRRPRRGPRSSSRCVCVAGQALGRRERRVPVRAAARPGAQRGERDDGRRRRRRRGRPQRYRAVVRGRGDQPGDGEGGRSAGRARSARRPRSRRRRPTSSPRRRRPRPLGEASFTARFTVRASDAVRVDRAGRAGGVRGDPGVGVRARRGGSWTTARPWPRRRRPEAEARRPDEFDPGRRRAHRGHRRRRRSAEVLTTLIGELVTATTPAVEEQSDDPLGALTYPRVTVEVDLRRRRRGRQPVRADAARLGDARRRDDGPRRADGRRALRHRAVRRGRGDEPDDGRRRRPRSGWPSAATSSSPRPSAPWCPTQDEARRTFPHAAYSSRFQIVSDRITAEVLQLLPAEVATSLERGVRGRVAARPAHSRRAPSRRRRRPTPPPRGRRRERSGSTRSATCRCASRPSSAAPACRSPTS